jgi:hypothetical protein
VTSPIDRVDALKKTAAHFGQQAKQKNNVVSMQQRAS